MILRFKHQKVITLIVCGFLVHALILKAAFDIYFSSPIDNGMTPIKSTSKAPAKRLVLIVADGLRAEAIFGENHTENAPNLNQIRKSRAAWGVSHTRVPTESRPGHVALLAGIYEDPAALLKGWKVNPVDFDSVINQSMNAWCWGGPSIINMFNRDNLSHINLYSYDSNMEDFGKNDTISLDAWVLDHVENFVEKQAACQECIHFRQSGNLFFLHLLGIDTAGHAFKPNSFEVEENIRFVDSNILRVEELFESAFPDESTAYVFTADHGMTNWGSHGAGSDHETKTPLIAWGAGIKSDRKRKDVQQIDIAPLISALIGLHYPINSLGKLPHDYINSTSDNLREMLMSNVLQLVEIFNVKRFRRMKNAVRFVQFQKFSTEDLNAKIIYLKSLTNFELLKNETEIFMKFLVDGADYYHNYYQLPILISITVGIVAWILFLATYNANVTATNYPGRNIKYVQILLIAPLYLNAILLLKIQSLPFMYYIYFLFPIFMIQILVRRYIYIVDSLRQIKRHGLRKVIGSIVMYGFGLRILVQTFHNRDSLSMALYVMAGCIMTSDSLYQNTTRKQKISWVVCCFLLSIFVFLPVMKTTFHMGNYLTGYVVWWIAIEKLVLTDLDRSTDTIIFLQHNLLKLTPYYTIAVEFGWVAADSPLKYFAWFWAFVPMVAIPASSTQIYARTTSIFIGFATFYFMVSSNVEVLFLIVYVLLLYAWLIIETKTSANGTIYNTGYNDNVNRTTPQSSEDFRRAFFFIVLIFVGFFGTGNIASLNSFDPMWVRCFLTVFSPFKMAGLILIRIMVPFIYASCAYRAINVLCKGNLLNMFCIVLMFSDVMLLELLYCITNVGSWLEIGMSLSQFVIMEAFVLIIILLYGFAYFLTKASYSGQ